MTTDTKETKEEQIQETGHVHGPNCNHDHKLEPIVRKGAKVGRNDPCSCGSKKKYKKCCGK